MTDNRTTPAREVPITQVDRELFRDLLGLDVTEDTRLILDGKFDGAWKMRRIAEHRLATSSAGVPAGWRLVEREADKDCGCPEECWDRPGSPEVHMHLAAGRPSNAHADNGDWEAEITVTADTIDQARAAIFGWADHLSIPVTAPKPEGGAEAEMAAIGASDAACYLYPGEDQSPERAAFCDGAAHAVSGLAPQGVEELRAALEAAGDALNGCEYATVIDTERAGKALAIVRAALADRGAQ